MLSFWAVIAALTLPANAQHLPDSIVQAQVLPGWTTERGTRMAALRLSLAPGWKTYWRAPGDAGIPPSFDWGGSANVAAVSIHWPTPDIFETAGMRSVGYAGDIVLPMEFRPSQSDAPMRVQARVDLGVCEDICVPASLTFEATLEGRGAPDASIRGALANQPMPGAYAGVRAVSCSFVPVPDGVQLTAMIDMPSLGREVAVVEAGDPRVWVSEPAVSWHGDYLRVVADLVPPYGESLALDRSALRFTVLGRGQAVDIRGCTE